MCTVTMIQHLQLLLGVTLHLLDFVGFYSMLGECNICIILIYLNKGCVCVYGF